MAAGGRLGSGGTPRLRCGAPGRQSGSGDARRHGPCRDTANGAHLGRQGGGRHGAAVREAGCDAPGIIVTTDENFAEIEGMRSCASAHPVPDERGLAAAKAVMEFVASLGEDDHLLLLISGGGSALLPAPADGMTLADKQALNEALLASGLDIHDMNAVRRLFSTLKGGRLARWAAPARITQFLLSDVPGDRFESIASGPATADPVPLDQALALIRDAGLDRLPFVKARLMRIEDGAADLPVRPGDPVMKNVTTYLLASNDLCRGASRVSMEVALVACRRRNCRRCQARPPTARGRLPVSWWRHRLRLPSGPLPAARQRSGLATIRVPAGGHRKWASPLPPRCADWRLAVTGRR